MATTSAERMRKKKERDLYSDPDSQITLNRAFVDRLIRLLRGTIEAEQLKVLVEDSRDRIKVQEDYSLWSRSFVT